MMLSKATVRASPAVPADLKGALLLRCARASNFAKTRMMGAARCRTDRGLVRAQGRVAGSLCTVVSFGRPMRDRESAGLQRRFSMRRRARSHGIPARMNTGAPLGRGIFATGMRGGIVQQIASSEPAQVGVGARRIDGAKGREMKASNNRDQPTNRRTRRAAKGNGEKKRRARTRR